MEGLGYFLLAAIPLILTVIGLVYASKQLRDTKNIARGDFLLRLDEAMQLHSKTHSRLRPGGDWAKPGEGPSTVEDWISVESYRGLFERIKVLIDSKILDIDTFDRLYGYQVLNILANERIRQVKLEKNKDAWSDFISLADEVEKNRKRKGSLS